MSCQKKSRSFSLWAWVIAIFGCGLCCSLPLLAGFLSSVGLVALATHAEIFALGVFILALAFGARWWSKAKHAAYCKKYCECQSDEKESGE